MDKKQPPDPGNQDLDTNSTDDKINTFNEVVNSFRAGIQPAVFLTHSFFTKTSHTPGGGLSDGKLGPDSRPLPPDQQVTDGERHRQAVGEVGAAQRVDSMGAGHPASALLP